MIEAQQASYAQQDNMIGDKANILEQLDPSFDSLRIINAMLGLEIVKKREGNQIVSHYVRVSKPEFTDEYVRNIESDLKHYLNFTIQVSRFQDETIRKKVGQFAASLNKDFCCHGDDNYISDETWKSILDIHSQKIKKENGELVSGWQKFDIYWDYNKPVNYDMVKLVKDIDEECDQVVKFRKYIKSIANVIHASFNKSYSINGSQQMGMLLGALAEVRTESTHIKENNEPKKKGFSIFSRPKEESNDWN